MAWNPFKRRRKPSTEDTDEENPDYEEEDEYRPSYEKELVTEKAEPSYEKEKRPSYSSMSYAPDSQRQEPSYEEPSHERYVPTFDESQPKTKEKEGSFRVVSGVEKRDILQRRIQPEQKTMEESVEKETDRQLSLDGMKDKLDAAGLLNKKYTMGKKPEGKTSEPQKAGEEPKPFKEEAMGGKSFAEKHPKAAKIAEEFSAEATWGRMKGGAKEFIKASGKSYRTSTSYVKSEGQRVGARGRRKYQSVTRQERDRRRSGMTTGLMTEGSSSGLTQGLMRESMFPREQRPYVGGVQGSERDFGLNKGNADLESLGIGGGKMDLIKGSSLMTAGSTSRSKTGKDISNLVGFYGKQKKTIGKKKNDLLGDGLGLNKKTADLFKSHKEVSLFGSKNLKLFNQKGSKSEVFGLGKRKQRLI